MGRSISNTFSVSKVLIIFFKEDKYFLPKIESILYEKNISSVSVDRDSVKSSLFSGKDLIIILGGDGTFLRANHFNKNIAMVGINADTEKKEGFFMQLNQNDYHQKLSMILSGFNTINLLRLNVEINNKSLPEYGPCR